MTTGRILASSRDFHVICGADQLWRVEQEGHPSALSSYRLRVHAMAFARAVAFAAHADMVVHDAAGIRTRHSRASLSYPTSLD